MLEKNKLEKLKQIFQQEVVIKYHLYKSLLLSLPYQGLERYGGLLSFFSRSIKPLQSEGKSAVEIVNSFFNQHLKADDVVEKRTILYKFIQFVEREVALFDAIEDAAFPVFLSEVKAVSLSQLLLKVEQENLQNKLAEVANNFRFRMVLTAHPTQFYPRRVLRVMEDLRIAISNSNINEVNSLLKQLGKTAFRAKKKPTPLDEANSIITTLEETLFDVIPKLEKSIFRVHQEMTEKHTVSDKEKTSDSSKNNISSIAGFRPLIELGFWPGGDRDGNPHVTAGVTEEVASLLKHAIVGCYLDVVRNLLRRLTFDGVYDGLLEIQEKLKQVSRSHGGYSSSDEFLSDLLAIERVLLEEHGGIFKDHLEKLLFSVCSFGFHFASLDLREDSRVHHAATKAVFAFLNDEEKSKERSFPKGLFAGYDSHDETKRISVLTKAIAAVKTMQKEGFSSGNSAELFVSEATLLKARKEGDAHVLQPALATLETICAAYRIQKKNGVRSLHRYIVSNTQKASNILELYFLLQIFCTSEEFLFDLVPLFETINDLRNSEEILRTLFAVPVYKNHIAMRNDLQIVMLGYSDGTKDGGYVASNWTIFSTKVTLSKTAESMGVGIVFFDGRGGPPSRGGGNTRNFYKALPSEINNKQIQLTIQGQTISANFSTKKKAAYNIGEILSAGLENAMGIDGAQHLTDNLQTMFAHMVEVSAKKYLHLKNDAGFLPYLQAISPLRFYGDSNIASRPTKRSGKSTLQLEDLRAIPFVSSWSQAKQIVPAFYGLGSALQSVHENYPHINLEKLYEESLFFRAILENSMQSLLKTDFKLTQKFLGFEKFVKLRSLIAKEDRLTRKWLGAIVNNTVEETFSKSSLTAKGNEEITKNGELAYTKDNQLFSKDFLMDDPVGRKSIEMRQKIILPLLVVQQYALNKLQQKNIPEQEMKIYEKMVIRSMIGAVNASRNSA